MTASPAALEDSCACMQHAYCTPRARGAGIRACCPPPCSRPYLGTSHPPSLKKSLFGSLPRPFATALEPAQVFLTLAKMDEAGCDFLVGEKVEQGVRNGTARVGEGQSYWPLLANGDS